MRALLLMALAVSWNGCSGDHRVPYTEEPDEPDPETPQQQFEPARSQSLEPGSRGVSVEGASIEAEGDIRALLPIDLDADGDRDVLAIEAGELISIVAARREGESFRNERLGRLAFEGCVLSEGSIETVLSDRAIAHATLTCEEETQGRAWWILAMGARPRVLESLSLRGEGEVQIRFEDVDQDEHADLIVDLNLGEAPLSLRWLDRPSGLAREHGEPEAAIRAAMQEDAQRGARLVASVCRSASPRLRIGTGAWGLTCPDELTRGALDARVAELLRSGRVAEAITLIDGPPSESVTAALQAAARGVRATRVTAWAGSVDRATAHVALAFDGNDLIVRGVMAQRFAANAPPSPAEAFPAPVSDSHNHHFVQRLERDCNGLQVHLLPTRQINGAGFASARSVNAFAAPLEDCQPPIADAGGWRALGWAPQGVVIGRVGERRTVPLTADALPAGDSLVLGDDDPPPAPLRGGRITPDGNTWILETPNGILRFGTNVELWRSADWQHGPVEAAAISPDGREIAILQRGAVWRLEPNE